MSDFVAIHPETGDKYPVHSKSELVNLIARGYRDGSPSTKRNGGGNGGSTSKSGPAGTAGKSNPTPPEADK